MKLLLIALILVCTLLSSALAEEDMPVARWDTPVVDGEDDPCWADAPVYTLRSGSTSSPSSSAAVSLRPCVSTRPTRISPPSSFMRRARDSMA